MVVNAYDDIIVYVLILNSDLNTTHTVLHYSIILKIFIS